MKKYIAMTLVLVGFLRAIGAAGSSDLGTAMKDCVPQALIGTGLAVSGMLWAMYEEEKEERMQDND